MCACGSLCVSLHINPPGCVWKTPTLIWSPFSVHYSRPPGRPRQIRTMSTSLTSSLKLKWPSLHLNAQNIHSYADQRTNTAEHVQTHTSRIHTSHTHTQSCLDNGVSWFQYHSPSGTLYWLPLRCVSAPLTQWGGGRGGCLCQRGQHKKLRMAHRLVRALHSSSSLRCGLQTIDGGE